MDHKIHTQRVASKRKDNNWTGVLFKAVRLACQKASAYNTRGVRGRISFKDDLKLLMINASLAGFIFFFLQSFSCLLIFPVCYRWRLYKNSLWICEKENLCLLYTALALPDYISVVSFTHSCVKMLKSKNRFGLPTKKPHRHSCSWLSLMWSFV